MQKIFLPFALLAISLSACSQESSLDKFYNKHHSSDDGAGNLLKSFSVNASYSGEDQKNWKNKVSQFRMLILDSKEDPSLNHDMQDLTQALRKDNFEDMFTVRNGKDNMQLLSKDEKGSLKEVVFLVNGKDGSCVFVDIKGKFNTHDMEQIQTSFQDKKGQGITIN